MRLLPVSEELRRDWRDAARAVRQKFVGSLVAKLLLDRVLAALAGWRIEHPGAERKEAAARIGRGGPICTAASHRT